jgi:hypothetical protein
MWCRKIMRKYGTCVSIFLLVNLFNQELARKLDTFLSLTKYFEEAIWNKSCKDQWKTPTFYAGHTFPISLGTFIFGSAMICRPILQLRKKEKQRSLFMQFRLQKSSMPITVAVRSKAWTVYAHANTEVVDSNPTCGMNVCVCLLCVWVLCVDSDFKTGRSPVKGVVPTLYRTEKLRTEGCRAVIIII